MEDFIGFTYNGKHCIKDFGIYRTSDGSRYNDNLVPSMTDKTADVPGGDGQYFFQTTHKNRQFSVSIAFDHLTEQKYREMRSWLDGREIRDLIFDEAPYKVYSAKVTGTPQLKTICFNEEGQRIYKGEGTIQFTCYWPYAHTPKAPEKALNKGEVKIDCNIVLEKNGDQKNYIYGSNLDCTIYYINEYTGEQGEYKYSANNGFFHFPNNPHGESDYKYRIQYVICKGKRESAGAGLEGEPLPDSNKWTLEITIVEDDGAEETRSKFVSTTRGLLECLPVGNGRTQYFYLDQLYPNKSEWILESGIPKVFNNGDNFGDLPAPFIVTGTVWKNSSPRNITVGNCSITLPPPQETFNLYWDSKSGLVCKVEENGKKVPIPYTGISYGTIPVGTASEQGPMDLDGLILDYDYWYY